MAAAARVGVGGGAGEETLGGAGEGDLALQGADLRGWRGLGCPGCLSWGCQGPDSASPREWKWTWFPEKATSCSRLPEGISD